MDAHEVSAGLVRGLKDCSPGVRQMYTTMPGIGQGPVIDRLALRRQALAYGECYGTYRMEVGIASTAVPTSF